MHLPLTRWTLLGENLPDRLFDQTQAPAFSLPGASALGAFADLIGEEDGEKSETISEGAEYSAGGFFEDDLCGALTLEREIDFGAFFGDRALLTFSRMAGSGEILLDGRCIARFSEDCQADPRHAASLTGMPCAIAVDVTEALMLGKKQKLCLRFDEQRPAGVIGSAFFTVTTHAHLSRVRIQPDVLRRTMTVRAQICAQQAGHYMLRVQPIPGDTTIAIPAARQSDVRLAAGEEKGLQLSLAVDAPVFARGQAYAAPALKIQLFFESPRGELLCDDALLMCGYGAAAPRAWLPLTRQECLEEPKRLCDRLCALGVHAASLPAPAPDALYLEMTRRGISAVQHVSEEIRSMFTRYPCISLTDQPMEEKTLSGQASAWQMAGSVAFPRAVQDGITPDELLTEASGRKLDGESPAMKDTLAWLRAVQIRMRAEAARQGRYQGAICSAGEWAKDDILDALKTAFAPVHLSALPLSGAWWTGTRFSASLEAFFPGEMPGEMQARAALEDEDGNELAGFSSVCKKSGYAGVIEATLPDHPCVLTLHCALLCGGEIMEENTMPVYVGERGPLEAAF